MKLTTPPNNFKASDFDFDSSYFVLATPGQITPLTFDGMGEVCFINCPFKESIKIPSYIQKIGNASAKRSLEEIQSLASKKITFDDRVSFTSLLIVLVSELKVNRTIFLEVAGLNQESIIELIVFCKRIMNIYRHKRIFIADTSNVHPQSNADIIIYKIDQQLIDQIITKGLNNFTGRKVSDLLS